MNSMEKAENHSSVKESKDSGSQSNSVQSNTVGQSQAGGENIDQVRDILFGPQIRDHDRRFLRLEARLQQVSLDLKDDVRKRFESLENYIKKEIESITVGLKAEQTKRLESVEQWSRELKDTHRSLEQKTIELDERSTTSQREIRQQLLDQSKKLADQIELKQGTLTASLENALEELRSEKTDRSALAGLFMELAARLNNELKVPGSD